jgi:hypothetical protein
VTVSFSNKVSLRTFQTALCVNSEIRSMEADIPARGEHNVVHPVVPEMVSGYGLVSSKPSREVRR